jgi:hypothetical protein
MNHQVIFTFDDYKETKHIDIPKDKYYVTLVDDKGEKKRIEIQEDDYNTLKEKQKYEEYEKEQMKLLEKAIEFENDIGVELVDCDQIDIIHSAYTHRCACTYDTDETLYILQHCINKRKDGCDNELLQGFIDKIKQKQKQKEDKERAEEEEIDNMWWPSYCARK